MVDQSLDTPAPASRVLPRLAVATAVLIAGCAFLLFVYSFDLGGLVPVAPPEQFCSALGGGFVCSAPASMLSKLALVAVALAIAANLAAGRRRLAAIWDAIVDHRPARGALVVSCFGLGLIVVPYALYVLGWSTQDMRGWGLWFWGIGLVAWMGGLVAWALPIGRVAAILGWPVLAALAVFLVAPELSWYLSRLTWAESTLQSATFSTVIAILEAWGAEVYGFPQEAVVHVDGFGVFVDHPCSGIAGILLSSAAYLGYVASMRCYLNVRRALLILPLLAGLSWALNAVRIAVLLLIGAHISPDLAVGGFHSYAGWIAFTLLTGMMILFVDRSAWFQKNAAVPMVPAADTLPLSRDPIAAQVLPFAVFLGSSLIAGAFFEVPTEGYALRVCLTVAALAFFWRLAPPLASLRLDPLAVGLGAVIAVVWVLGQQQNDPVVLQELVPNLTGGALTLWIVFRLIGTSLVVPIVEELAFRGYLLKRLDFGGVYGPWVALVVSSAAFAALHASVGLAFLAGLAFGLLVWRTGRVWDAVVAHAVANALIGGVALVTGNWGLI